MRSRCTLCGRTQIVFITTYVYHPATSSMYLPSDISVSNRQRPLQAWFSALVRVFEHTGAHRYYGSRKWSSLTASKRALIPFTFEAVHRSLREAGDIITWHRSRGMRKTCWPFIFHLVCAHPYPPSAIHVSYFADIVLHAAGDWIYEILSRVEIWRGGLNDRLTQASRSRRLLLSFCFPPISIWSGAGTTFTQPELRVVPLSQV